jgi:DNA-binding NarL/FixJ family response regulator
MFMDILEKNSTAKRRVLVVDDHPIVRQGLAALINQEPDLVVCGEAASVPDAMAAIETLRPDIALVDLSLSGASGIELIKILKSRPERIPILVISMHDESLYAERMLRAGARGYIMKQEATDRLLGAVRHVLSGEIYLSEQMISRILHKLVEGPESGGVPLERLSDRELEVFQMIGQGLQTRQIAEKLGVSSKTVETYRTHIRRRLELRNAGELFERAREWMRENQAKLASRLSFDPELEGPHASVGSE